MPQEKPFINTHTHIFTANDVPPFLARKMVVWPLHIFTHIPTILKIRRWYLKKVDHRLYKLRFHYQRFLTFLNTSWVSVFYFGILYFFMALSAAFIYVYFKDWEFPIEVSNGMRIFVLVVTLLLLPQSRKLLISLASIFYTPLKYINNGNFWQFLKRYMLIVTYAGYNDQKNTFNKLFKMYPANSKFVVLTMDMAYMGAGTPPNDYLKQISQLQKLRKVTSKNLNYKKLIPFLCVDPRRIRDHKKHHEQAFFKYDLTIESKVVLMDCVVKDCLEGKNGQEATFFGIKLYPALGFYPFDESLLPLWLYCVQRGIPITTHCILGTIYYRGKHALDSLRHPVFLYGGDALRLKGSTNGKFQFNHTHPLNYLVLLDDKLLARHIGENCNDATKRLFGYDAEKGTIAHSLASLKINLAHYGGEDQWALFLERDRQDIAQHITRFQHSGAKLVNDGPKDNPGTDRAAWLWDKGDWFTLITSMMLQYQNVYADISYTLHDEKIYPLLKQCLRNVKLRRKILFGTDFYVVRNHLSEKNILTQLLHHLSQSEVRYIAYDNPDKFLAQIDNDVKV